MVKLPVGSYPSPVVLSTGGASAPWRGMRDAREPTAQVDDKVLLAQNMYLSRGGRGRAYTGRPGCSPLGAAFASAVQWCESWYDSAGVVRTIAVAGGQVYRYDWGAGAFVLAVSTANLTSISAAIASTGRVAFVPYADGLVFADGVNKMVHWSGVDGAGGLTKMTKAPVPYGRPWVHAAKLLVIDASSRLTIMWSEEGEINLGFDQDGYSNAWDVIQVGTAPLTAGIGFNGGLVLFRERSCFSITGAVGPDFQTASTRADLSSRVGTRSPWSVLPMENNTVAFVDADGQPSLLQIGGGVVSLADDCAENILPDSVPRGLLDLVITLEDGATKTLLFGMPTTLTDKIGKWLVYDQESRAFVGVWTQADADTAAPVLTDAGEPRWVHSAGPNVYLHGDPSIGPWDDAFRAGTLPIPHAMEGPCLGRDLTEELFVDAVEIGLSGSQASQVTITGETPRGVLPSLLTAVRGSVGDKVGMFILGTGKLGSITREARVMVGQSGLGRWVRPIMRHMELAERIAVTDMRVKCFLDGDDPMVQ